MDSSNVHSIFQSQLAGSIRYVVAPGALGPPGGPQLILSSMAGSRSLFLLCLPLLWDLVGGQLLPTLPVPGCPVTVTVTANVCLGLPTSTVTVTRKFHLILYLLASVGGS